MLNIIKVNKYIQNIINDLFVKKIIGGKHTEEIHIFKKFKHLSPIERKNAVTDWKKCIKEELVLQKKSTGQIHISLNPRKIKEIMELIDENER